MKLKKVLPDAKVVNENKNVSRDFNNNKLLKNQNKR